MSNLAIVKLRIVKRAWSHCHICGKDDRDKEHSNARNELIIRARHGIYSQGYASFWVCDECLQKVSKQVAEVANHA